MLDDALKSQLQQYLGLLRQPIRLIASLDDSETGNDMKNLLDTIMTLFPSLRLPATWEVPPAPPAPLLAGSRGARSRRAPPPPAVRW